MCSTLGVNYYTKSVNNNGSIYVSLQFYLGELDLWPVRQNANSFRLIVLKGSACCSRSKALGLPKCKSLSCRLRPTDL